MMENFTVPLTLTELCPAGLRATIPISKTLSEKDTKKFLEYVRSFFLHQETLLCQLTFPKRNLELVLSSPEIEICLEFTVTQQGVSIKSGRLHSTEIIIRMNNTS